VHNCLVPVWPDHVFKLALYVLEIADECAHIYGSLRLVNKKALRAFMYSL
jgi:hypothetical protein